MHCPSCNGSFSLTVHREFTNDTYSVVRCCEECGLLEVKAGPFSSYKAAEENLGGFQTIRECNAEEHPALRYDGYCCE